MVGYQMLCEGKRFWRSVIGYENGADNGQILKAYFSEKIKKSRDPLGLDTKKQKNECGLKSNKNLGKSYKKFLNLYFAGV
ncbi:hypothetical protein BpHYR1_013950 [Brachionus plicatilis]|uniref:Uncharacterized protein n=1 Tax=Brachionus plicatilis TaxID=10195 RepID=A0A3M7R3U8_BRAPC|nr:hypothetical protein BpHYR1_013950 [Brachionus plicatilis]